MAQGLLFRTQPLHDGPDLTLEDHLRLGHQLAAVLYVMQDGQWHTLGEVAQRVRAPEASVSARLRDLRKPKFGLWTVERRRAGRALYTYRVRV